MKQIKRFLKKPIEPVRKYSRHSIKCDEFATVQDIIDFSVKHETTPRDMLVEYNRIEYTGLEHDKIFMRKQTDYVTRKKTYDDWVASNGGALVVEAQRRRRDQKRTLISNKNKLTNIAKVIDKLEASRNDNNVKIIQAKAKLAETIQDIAILEKLLNTPSTEDDTSLKPTPGE